MKNPFEKKKEDDDEAEKLKEELTETFQYPETEMRRLQNRFNVLIQNGLSIDEAWEQLIKEEREAKSKPPVAYREDSSVPGVVEKLIKKPDDLFPRAEL